MIKVVKFHAPWCGPCKQLAPVIEQIKTEYNIEVEDVNIDEKPERANEAKVRAVPTLQVFKDGQLVTTFSGMRSKADLIKLFGL